MVTNKIANALDQSLNIRGISILFIIAVALSASSLFSGYMGDDYMHHALLMKNPPITPPQDASLYGLFSFMGDDSKRTKELMNLGILPWWTFEEMRYSFWRPISEFTHFIDHLLWPNSSVLKQLQNLIWYLVLCGLALNLFYRINTEISGRFILLGFASYLLDSTHGFTISWLANRNALVATTFGLLSISFHIKYRTTDNFRDLVSSIIALCCSLLSAEFGISTTAFLAAYAITLDKDGFLKGTIRLIPHILVVIVWWMSYKALGFGAAHADGYYIDPIASPLEFLNTASERVAVLLGSQWGILPAELFGFAGELDGVKSFVLFVSCTFILLLSMLVFPLLRGDKKLRFWLVGMLVSAIPAATAIPHDRVLLFVGIGAFGAFIRILAYYLDTPPKTKAGHGSVKGTPSYLKSICSMFIIIHLVLSPLLLPITAYSTKIWDNQISKAPKDFDDIPNISDKSIVLFNAPMASTLMINIWRFIENKPLPNHLWPISMVDATIAVRRIGDNTIALNNDQGFIQGPETSVRNLNKQPFKMGHYIELDGLKIFIKEINKSGHPTVLHLEFDRPIENHNLLFLQWKDNHYKKLNIPNNVVDQTLITG